MDLRKKVLGIYQERILIKLGRKSDTVITVNDRSGTEKGNPRTLPVFVTLSKAFQDADIDKPHSALVLV